MRPIVIVGVGRLGGALGLALKQAKFPVRVLPRAASSTRRAVELGLPLADEVDLHEAELCFFAVADREVRATVEGTLPSLGPRTILVHCAGALTLGALADRRVAGARPRASFHPLCAISDPRDPLSGHAVAISATNPRVRTRLSRLGKRLGLFPIVVPERGRALYHAGAVLSAGGLVALLSAAVSALARGGVPERDAVGALLPLMRSALAGVERRGLASGLTGPIPRGDADVVAEHLRRLPVPLVDLYRRLALTAFGLVRDHLPENRARALSQVLKAGGR